MTEAKNSLPKADFAFFCYSLGSQVMVHLGLAPNPASGEVEEDLTQAKYTIDLIEMLKDKTAGNLTDEESKLMMSLLFDLRMRYVEKSRIS
jgi:uncharacterized protein DUF1844